MTNVISDKPRFSARNIIYYCITPPAYTKIKNIIINYIVCCRCNADKCAELQFIERHFCCGFLYVCIVLINGETLARF